MDYLKDKQHYIDRYDLITIEQCLEVVDVYRTVYKKSLEDKDQLKKFTHGDMAKTSNWMANQHLFLVKAKRYQLKEETIQKWMSDDQIKQDKYDNTSEPENVCCPNCKNLMHCKHKHLEFLDDPLVMTYIFECSACKKRCWINEDGTERKTKPQPCPKCKSEVEMTAVKESKDKIIWKTTCSSCGFTETSVDDFAKSRAEHLKQEERDKKLLEAYREEFCSEERGKEAFEYVDSLDVAKEAFDEEFKKYDSFAYQQVSQLKKLSITELEQLLRPIFDNEKYLNLKLENPEIGQYVIVTFSIQDSESSRKQEASIDHLQKLIKDTLEGTNWRLMSDGLSYRLGFISGRLKGYEREEEFFELSGQKKEIESSKIDYEKRMKYAGTNTVQLARFMGEFKGIENTRKRRLSKELEGFFLNSSEGPYTCCICRESTPGENTWWNLDGLRCADCWRNIKEGVLPPLKWDNEGVWIPDWQISNYGVHPGTRKKLERQGMLRGRHLQRSDGSIYSTIYLVEENHEFLKQYKIKDKPKFIITDLLGNKLVL